MTEKLPESDAWRERSISVLREILSDLPFEELDLELKHERETWSAPILASVRTQVFKVWRELGVFRVTVDAFGEARSWNCPEWEDPPAAPSNEAGDPLKIARTVLPPDCRYVRTERLDPAHLVEVFYADPEGPLSVRVNLATRRVVAFRRGDR